MGILKLSKTEMAKAFKDAAKSGAVVREKVSLSEPGEGLRGVLLRAGEAIELEQKKPDGTVEKNSVGTWDFDLGDGQEGWIMSSAQLDSRLPPLVGHELMIVRDVNVKSRSGMQVGNYQIADFGAPTTTKGKKKK